MTFDLDMFAILADQLDEVGRDDSAALIRMLHLHLTQLWVKRVRGRISFRWLNLAPPERRYYAQIYDARGRIVTSDIELGPWSFELSYGDQWLKPGERVPYCSFDCTAADGKIWLSPFTLMVSYCPDCQSQYLRSMEAVIAFAIVLPVGASGEETPFDIIVELA